MKKAILLLLFINLAVPAWAGTVGGPDMSVPEESMFLKQEAINKTLDRYESNMNIKGAFEAEIITKKSLDSAEGDSTNMSYKGQNYWIKLSSNFYNVFEPYFKLGSSVLEIKWDDSKGFDVKVETDPAFVWAMGAKAKLFKSETYGVSLTLDGQFREIELDVDSAKLNGSKETAAAKNEDFHIKELQLSLLASKKFVVLLGDSDYYLVPYTGLTWTSSDVDVHFTQDGTEALFSSYDASDKEEFGIVFGCDIMPFYLSYYLLNLELRFINETAFTLGGTIKF